VSLLRFWAFLAVALPVLAALLASLPTPDLAYHLRAGSEILATGQIPATDTWTFTAQGLPWVDQQWGAQLTFELVYRAGGWVGLVVLRAVLVAAMFGSLFELCRRRGIGLRLASWLTIGAFLVTAPALALRPQLIGMALFAVTLLIVSDRHSHPRRLWIVPIITVVWANSHGSFFLAPAVLGLAWLADLTLLGRDRHLPIVVAVVAAVAACVTPFGVGVWGYAVGLGTNAGVTARITEWQPTSLREPIGIAFFGSAMLVALFLARRGRRVPFVTLAWLAFFFLIGAYAERGIAWWPMAAVAAIVTLLEPRPETARVEPNPIRLANRGLAVALILAAIVLVPFWRPVDPNVGAPVGTLTYAPSELTGALRRIAQPGDRVLNPQIWGSWFEFSVPDLPVAIDSRIELFPESIWDEYTLVTTGGPGWESILNRWQVAVVVVRAGDDSFANRLRAAGWRAVFASVEGLILTRDL
jgi:hypothetical protein